MGGEEGREEGEGGGEGGREERVFDGGVAGRNDGASDAGKEVEEERKGKETKDMGWMDQEKGKGNGCR